MKASRKFFGITASLAVMGIAWMMGIQVEDSRSHSVSPELVKDERAVKEILLEARRDFRARSRSEAFYRFRATCDELIEKKIVPPRFEVLNADLGRKLEFEHFGLAAKDVREMIELCPESVSDSIFANDPKTTLRLALADILAYSNDYSGALKAYNDVRTITVNELKHPEEHSMSLAAAANGQGLMTALLGRTQESEQHLNEVPKIFSSGCGNCMTGQSHSLDRMRTVYEAANQSPIESEVQLLKLARGGYVPKYSDLTASAQDEQRWIREDAVFFLGEHYLKQGRKEMAKAAFAAVAELNNGALAYMAKSRLRTI